MDSGCTWTSSSGCQVFLTLLSYPDVADWMDAEAFDAVSACSDPNTVGLGHGEPARAAGAAPALRAGSVDPNRALRTE